MRPSSSAFRQTGSSSSAARSRFDGSRPRRALLRRQLQPVADPELGQYVGRPRRVGLQLLPQPANTDPEILDLLGLRRPPHLAQQLAVRQHLAGMSDEMANNSNSLGDSLTSLPPRV